MRLLIFILAAWYLLVKQPAGSGVFTLTGIPFSTLADAIQVHEGWFEGSRSYRNNNPGNLRYAGQYEASGQDAQGFAIFPTYDAGRRALIAQLKLDARRHPEWSLWDFVSSYAPATENNVAAYVDSLITSLKARGFTASVNTTLGEFV